MSDHWAKLNPTQRMALTLTVLILALLVAVVVQMAAKTTYVPLYTNLSQADSQTIAQKLREKNIPFRMGNAGIEVPESKLQEVRMSMATEGLPSSSKDGYDILDKAQFGKSEFMERIDNLRALQGELQQTIETLDFVQSARVHLALPQQRLYEAQQKPASASVTLQLKGGDAPAPREIKGIIHMVASAVEGLSADNVTVVDTTGRLLSEMTDTANGNMDTRLQDQRVVEAQYEARIQHMLDRVLGPDKSLVGVSVLLNYDHRNVERETYVPVASTAANEPPHGVLRNAHVSSEIYDNTKASAATTPPNISLTAPRNAGYTRTDTTNDYAVSKEVERVDYGVGKVQEVSVAVFVDEAVPAEVRAQLPQTIATAVGTKAELVRVQASKFDTTARETADKEEKVAAQQARMTGLVKTGGSVLLVVAFLAILFIFFARATAQPRPQPGMLPEGAGPVMLTAPSRAVGQYSAVARSELPEGESLDLSQVDPQRVAQVIQGMLGDDR
jgi:flagellar M-ring protein FliF